jgi:predicted Zn-dependent peptidase
MKDIHREILESGATLLVDERPLPVATIFIATKFGSGYDDPKYKGAAHFLEHMLFKGTKKRGQKEISSEIEKVGGEINAFTNNQMTAFYAKMPRKHLVRGIDILSDMIFNSKLEENEIEKERTVVFEEIKRKHDLPSQYVIDKLKEALYSTPFGMPIIGSIETVGRIQRKELQEYYSKYYSPENLIFAVVGDVKRVVVKKEVEMRIPRIKKGPIPSLSPTLIAGKYAEMRGDIQQAHFALGFHMPTLSDRKRYAAEIFDCILGKGMSSRLWQEIREKRGLAYTAHSYLAQEKDYGFETAYVGTKKEKLKEVESITLEQIKSLQKVEQKEVEDAKENLIGSHEVASERSEDIAINLLLNEISGKAEEYYKYPERISDVKLEEVRDLGKIKKYSTVVLAPKK